MRQVDTELHPAMQNKLLCALSAESRHRILSASSFQELPLKHVLYAPGQQNQFAYFITSGVGSVVVQMEDGESAEVALVGREGFAASLRMLGPAAIPTTCFIQLAGTAYRIRESQLEALFHTSEEIRCRLTEFVQQQSFTLSQVSGCNRLHQAGPRLARWLLMAQDRANQPVLNFTQEFLAIMLGLQRTTVNSIAGALHEEGLIDYSRGRLVILNRPALEKKACECYGVIQTLLAGLYREKWSPYAANKADPSGRE